MSGRILSIGKTDRPPESERSVEGFTATPRDSVVGREEIPRSSFTTRVAVQFPASKIREVITPRVLTGGTVVGISVNVQR